MKGVRNKVKQTCVNPSPSLWNGTFPILQSYLHFPFSPRQTNHCPESDGDDFLAVLYRVSSHANLP